MTTPVYTPPVDEIFTAFLDLLRGTNRKVWDSAYEGDPVNPVYPYGIGYAPAGGSADPIPDLDLDLRTVDIPLQVTAVSDVRNQCQFLGRQFRDRVLARSPTGFLYPLAMPTGWVCTHRRPDPALPGVDRTGNSAPFIYTQPARYVITVTPTA